MKTGIVLLSLCILCTAAQALKVDNIEFPDTYAAGTNTLVRKGVGIVRYMVVFKANIIGLYLPQNVTPVRALDEIPRRLEFQYYHAITSNDFAAMTRVWIQKNISPSAYAALKKDIAAFNALYRSVKPGDRYSLTYIPGQGTELRLNSSALGVIPGSVFSKALFSIWLGPVPVSKALKENFMNEKFGVKEYNK
jgi:hypothetical protein